MSIPTPSERYQKLLTQASFEADPAQQVVVARFDDPKTPYHAVPRPDRAPVFSDYAHLARIKEWSAGVLGEDTE